MDCCRISGIEEWFGEPYVSKALARYRQKGPIRTTRMLLEAIKETGVREQTLLDIGGGVGAIQHELLGAGLVHATDVDASTAYLAAAQAEAQRRGLADRVSFRAGNFVDLAAQIDPVDIVTLDRVICCYPDMEMLVSLSAARARKLYGLVYPRDTWWLRLGMAIMNFFYRLQHSTYRAFVHPSQAVEAILRRQGFQRRHYHQTPIWQVVVYSK